MNKREMKKTVQSKGTLPRPVMVAMAVAIFGVLGMLIVDHGPWNRPKVQTAEIVHYTTTGAAARAVGATVTRPRPNWNRSPSRPGRNPLNRRTRYPVRERLSPPNFGSSKPQILLVRR
jgi:hypothetical protein